MTDIIQLIQQDTTTVIFSYVLPFLGAIGVFFSIYTYFQSRRGQKPKYMVMTSTFESKMIENSSIEIRHSDRALQDFAISKVAVWNAGTTIKREDVATKAPFHLTATGETEILEVLLLFAEDKNDVAWSLSEDRKNLVLSFDYLAHNDGFVMKVFHTGTKAGDLKIEGCLTSGRDLSRSEWHMFTLARLFSNRVSIQGLRKFYGCVIILLSTIAIVESVISYNTQVPLIKMNLTGTILQVALYLVLAIYAYRTLISSRLPKKLEKHFYGG